jgi:hypothetical protein
MFETASVNVTGDKAVVLPGMNVAEDEIDDEVGMVLTKSGGRWKLSLASVIRQATTQDRGLDELLEEARTMTGRVEQAAADTAAGKYKTVDEVIRAATAFGGEVDEDEDDEQEIVPGQAEADPPIKDKD